MNERTENWIFRIAILSLILGAWFAYADTMHVPFLLDDSVRIVSNEKIRTIWPSSATLATNRPAVDYTFALDYWVHGLDLPGYHIVNLSIHIVASLMLFGIARISLGSCNPILANNRTLLALLIAWLWVAHPIQTQAVTYVNQRYESLMGLAYLGALLCFAVSVNSPCPWRWQLLSILVCAFGMGCKEAMFSAPLIVLWYDRAFFAPSWWELWRKRWAYYLGLSMSWMVLAWAMLHYTDEYTAGGMVSVAGVTPWEYLLSQSGVILHYLRLSVWPQGLCFWGDWPVAHSLSDVLPQASAIASLLVFTVIAIWRWPRCSFLGGWFFLILAPTSSFVPIRDFVFEHRMYLPLAAVSSAMVVGSYMLLRRCDIKEREAQLGHAALFLILIAALTVATRERNNVYRSAITLWQDTTVKAPNHAAAWHNMGLAYVEEGRKQEALESLHRAEILAPDRAVMQASYGAALLESGDLVEAKLHLEKAIALDDRDYLPMRNLATLLIQTGHGDEAIGYSKRAVALRPTDLESELTLCSAYLSVGRWDEAIAEGLVVLDQDPANVEARIRLMSAYSQSGQTSEAVRVGRQAIELEPRNAAALGSLGLLMAGIAPGQAITLLERACQMDGSTEEYRFVLAVLLSRNQPAQSIGHLNILLEIDPDNVEVRTQLAANFVKLKEWDKAIEQLEAAIMLRPDAVEIQEALQRLRSESQQR